MYLSKTLLLFVLLFTSAAIKATAQTPGPSAIIGVWLNEEKDGKIEIYQSGDKYYGKLIWGRNLILSDGRLRLDDNNPDYHLKARNLLNLVILTDFVYKDGDWEDGKIYDPKSGKTYSSVIKFAGNKLNIRGYVGISLFGRTTVWTRAAR